MTKSAAGTKRKFDFDGSEDANGDRIWKINGKLFDPARMDAQPKLNATDVWEFHADPAHPIHLHLIQFKVISRDGGKPGPYDGGWKDTVNLSEGSKAKIIAKFSGYQGRFVLHCHKLEHEDMAMMANFQVV